MVCIGIGNDHNVDIGRGTELFGARCDLGRLAENPLGAMAQGILGNVAETGYPEAMAEEVDVWDVPHATCEISLHPMMPTRKTGAAVVSCAMLFDGDLILRSLKAENNAKMCY